VLLGAALGKRVLHTVLINARRSEYVRSRAKIRDSAVDPAWNAKDLDAAVELLAEEYVRHDANLPEVVGPRAQRDFLAGLFMAFPDLNLQPERLIAQENLVVLHFTVQGTNRGEFMGMPATGREVMIQGVDIFRLIGDKIAEQWVVMDVLSLMQQLGAIPIPT
jgi:steroid delta-isomerase-like uncharacterized protein